MACHAKFCVSLRHRKEWAELPERLLSMKMPKWNELHLDTHDLEIPYSSKNDTDYREKFRLVLISHIDFQKPSTIARIEKIYHEYGGSNVGILFLLSGKFKEDRSLTFMNTQASFFPDLEIPILPLFNIDALQDTISAFQSQLNQPLKDPALKSSAASLLPYCSNNPPIEEHAKNILSDLCSNILELKALVTHAEGLERFGSLLSDYPQLFEDLQGFWHDEYIAD